ncbi:MAG: hypothetical protein QOE70_1285 [Chthoniobacter sp.]|jgi:hypothetical protein|nr:hypothetical protein [Chthoniobacter sp.]
MTEVALARETKVTTRQLIGVLTAALCRNRRRPCRIVSLTRRLSPYSTSFSLEELDVELDNGTTLELMFKDLNWFSMLKASQLVKPFFLYDPTREIETYRRILKLDKFGTPKCLATVIDPAKGHYWLFMERVPGLQLRHVGDFDIWLEAARFLAHLHSRFSCDEKLAAVGHRSNLLSYDRTLYRQWILRAEFLLHREEATHPPKARRDIRWLASRYHKVIESLLSVPTTFIHGEFYASNVVVRPTANGAHTRLCPVDWEMAAIGPGLIDLAALCAGNWTEDQKFALAEAYRIAFSGPGLGSTRSLLRQLDRCYLHQSIQWLGWSLEWNPPEDQSQNWLEIAMQLALRLKL